MKLQNMLIRPYTDIRSCSKAMRELR